MNIEKLMDGCPTTARKVYFNEIPKALTDLPSSDLPVSFAGIQIAVNKNLPEDTMVFVDKDEFILSMVKIKKPLHYTMQVMGVLISSKAMDEFEGHTTEEVLKVVEDLITRTGIDMTAFEDFLSSLSEHERETLARNSDDHYDSKIISIVTKAPQEAIDCMGAALQALDEMSDEDAAEIMNEVLGK